MINSLWKSQKMRRDDWHLLQHDTSHSAAPIWERSFCKEEARIFMVFLLVTSQLLGKMISSMVIKYKTLILISSTLKCDNKLLGKLLFLPGTQFPFLENVKTSKVFFLFLMLLIMLMKCKSTFSTLSLFQNAKYCMLLGAGVRGEMPFSCWCWLRKESIAVLDLILNIACGGREWKYLNGSSIPH